MNWEQILSSTIFRYSITMQFAFVLFCFSFLKLFFREKEGGSGGEGERRERETSICCSTYFRIHWLIFVCALTRDQTCNLGISRQCFNQLSYLARAYNLHLKSSLPVFKNSFTYSSPIFFIILQCELCMGSFPHFINNQKDFKKLNDLSITTHTLENKLQG